jgi:hypothetical protein
VYQLPLDASREYGRSYHGLGGGVGSVVEGTERLLKVSVCAWRLIGATF